MGVVGAGGRAAGSLPAPSLGHEGAYPGDSSRWVNAKDELSLSLLQARLIDLKMPIRIAEGT
jgi:hypothetical protein